MSLAFLHKISKTTPKSKIDKIRLMLFNVTELQEKL